MQKKVRFRENARNRVYDEIGEGTQKRYTAKNGQEPWKMVLRIVSSHQRRAVCRSGLTVISPSYRNSRASASGNGSIPPVGPEPHPDTISHLEITHLHLGIKVIPPIIPHRSPVHSRITNESEINRGPEREVPPEHEEGKEKRNEEEREDAKGKGRGSVRKNARKNARNNARNNARKNAREQVGVEASVKRTRTARWR